MKLKDTKRETILQLTFEIQDGQDTYKYIEYLKEMNIVHYELYKNGFDCRKVLQHKELQEILFQIENLTDDINK